MILFNLRYFALGEVGSHNGPKNNFGADVAVIYHHIIIFDFV